MKAISCERTTHRLIRRVFLMPPHHPLECLREPTPAPWRSGGWLVTLGPERFRSKWGSSSAQGRPRCDFPGKSGQAGFSGCRLGVTAVIPERSECPCPERTPAGVADSNLHDDLSLLKVESSTMRCPKKLHDALSIRTWSSRTTAATAGADGADGGCSLSGEEGNR